MASNAEQKLRRYDELNKAAADIVRASPERYPGAMQEWAHLVYRKAFHSPDPNRDGLSEERALRI